MNLALIVSMAIRVLAAGCCLALAISDSAASRPPLDRPNFVIVFLDDCGYGDFSHTGNPSIHTPNISRLVAEGLNFPQFYSASPACSASRYALLTGRSPARSGFNWVLGPNAAKYLHPEETTLAEGLREVGYASGIFGKWHLGNPNEANGFTVDAFPLAHGFETWIGSNVSNDYNPGADLIRSADDGTTPIDGYKMLAKDYALDDELQGALTRRYTDEAISFIKRHREQPFLVYLPFGMPHLPVHASPAAQGRSKRGLYGDVIEEIDANVGRLRAVLEDAGIAENTLLIFTSDNGPWIRFQHTPTHDRYGEARLNIGSALPFRDGKGSTWEGGVRVPGVFWWPGTIAPMSVVREPASAMDLLPTLFGLAGLSAPDDRVLDGRDISFYLSPDKFPGNVDDFAFIYTGASKNGVYGARRGPWKLHVKLYSQTGDNYGFEASRTKPLLFHVNHDPSERYDRAAEHPDVVEQLQLDIERFERSLSTEGTYWDP